MSNLFLSCSKKNFCFAYMTVTKSTAIFLTILSSYMPVWSCFLVVKSNSSFFGGWSLSQPVSHHTSTCAFATRGFQTLFLSKTVYVLSGDVRGCKISDRSCLYPHHSPPGLYTDLECCANLKLLQSFYKNCKSSCLKELKKRKTSS